MNIISELKSAMEDFPVGSIVWHKASGKRGVVVSYLVYPSMISINLSTDTGGFDSCSKCTLSKKPVKIPSYEDGEEWKGAME